MKRYSVLPILVCWLMILFVIGTISGHRQMIEEEAQAKLESQPDQNLLNTQVTYTESQK